jgi:hypothetical protein
MKDKIVKGMKKKFLYSIVLNVDQIQKERFYMCSENNNSSVYKHIFVYIEKSIASRIYKE